ncbi:hypothetical protein HDV62DRAFT_299254 [Trichoderma sp. SZMC 28011]
MRPSKRVAAAGSSREGAKACRYPAWYSIFFVDDPETGYWLIFPMWLLTAAPDVRCQRCQHHKACAATTRRSEWKLKTARYHNAGGH